MAPDVLRIPKIKFLTGFLISFRDNRPEGGAIRKDSLDDIDQQLVFVVWDTDSTTFRWFHHDLLVEWMSNWLDYKAKVVDVDI